MSTSEAFAEQNVFIEFRLEDMRKKLREDVRLEVRQGVAKLERRFDRLEERLFKGKPQG